MSAPRASSKNINASKKIASNPSSSRARVSKNEPGASSRIIGASSRLVSSNTQAGAGGGGSASTQVYLDGVNVTPQSLLYTRQKTVSKNTRAKAPKAKASDANSAVSGNQSTASLAFSDDNSSSDSAKSIDAILANAPPPMKKKLDMDSNNADADAESLAAVGGLEHHTDSADMKALGDRRSSMEGSRPSSGSRPPSAPAAPPAVLDGFVNVRFMETPTIVLFSSASICVGQDTPEHGQVVAKNKKYLEMRSSKRGSDNFVENRAQTLQLAQKTKEVMTAPPATRDAASSATSWDIFDCHENDQDASGNDHDDLETTTAATAPTTLSSSGGSSAKLKTAAENAADSVDVQLTRQVDDIVRASLASPGCLLLTDGADLLNDLKARQRALQPSARQKAAPNPPSNYHHNGDSKSSAAFSRASRLVSNNPSTNLSRAVHSNTNPGGNGNGNGGSTSNATLSSSDAAAGNNNSSSDNLSRSSTGSDGTNSTDGGVGNGMNAPGNAYANANTNVDLAQVIAEQKTRDVLASASLVKTLRILERAVQQSRFHDRHVLYRNFPRLTASSSSSSSLEPPRPSTSPSSMLSLAPDLEKLWSFACDLTTNRTVTSMAWNPVNDDLLAVAYGQFDAGDVHDGLVLFWSLKNPEYPERIYTLGCGVTSIDFSRVHPNLLAVGFHNGVVALFDTRKDGNEPILTSENFTGSHLDVVWQVKWVHKGSERGESIVSVSSDGRVTEWSMKKGLSFVDLMTLKRVPNPLVGSDAARIDGVIARQASGTSIQFAPYDTSVYFVGTEDGHIHKCSVSYNEQYLETYYGHTAAVYGIHMSPFWSELVLSCSADWTVKLWHQAEPQELLTFRSVDLAHGVYAIAWCPNHATIFGSVTEDGRVEIWDLEQSVLDPIVTHVPKENVPCTAISFAPSSPVLVVGDATGDVTVYRVPTLAQGLQMTTDEQIERLKRVVKPHQGE
ncbi:unnamed protein product [Aphanomyces euteiches]